MKAPNKAFGSLFMLVGRYWHRQDMLNSLKQH